MSNVCPLNVQKCIIAQTNDTCVQVFGRVVAICNVEGLQTVILGIKREQASFEWISTGLH